MNTKIALLDNYELCVRVSRQRRFKSWKKNLYQPTTREHTILLGLHKFYHYQSPPSNQKFFGISSFFQLPLSIESQSCPNQRQASGSSFTATSSNSFISVSKILNVTLLSTKSLAMGYSLQHGYCHFSSIKNSTSTLCS